MRGVGRLRSLVAMVLAAAAMLLVAAPAAYAQCNTVGTTVTCNSTATGFDAGAANGLTVNIQSGASITNPGTTVINLNDGNAVTNRGTVTSSGGVEAIVATDNNAITNNN